MSMAEGAVGGQHLNGLDSRSNNDVPLDFSVRRGHVTPMTSSQAAVVVTSPPVAVPAPPPSVLFPQLLDPALMSALSAAGLLPRPPATVTSPACRPTDVTEQVRAYVQSKIAEEQRRLVQRASSSSSSSSGESCADRTASPVRSSPTSTTTTSVGFEALPHHWPPAAMPPPLTTTPSTVVSDQSSSFAASVASRKRSSSCTDTPAASRDTHYWERRRKNNEAAKRSRDARRAKEEEVAVRASILEQENRQLRVELTAFRLEVARLSELLCRQVAAAQQPSSTPSTVAVSKSQTNSPR